MSRVTVILRDLRDKNNRTQGYVGAKLGMSQSQYNKIEKGEKPMDIHTLIRIGEMFDIQPSQLFMSIYEEKNIQFSSISNADIQEAERTMDVSFYKKMAAYYEKKFLKTYRAYVEICYKNGIENYEEEAAC